MISAPYETQAQPVFSSKAWVEEAPVPYPAACSESTCQGCYIVLRLELLVSCSVMVAECAWASLLPRDWSYMGSETGSLWCLCLFVYLLSPSSPFSQVPKYCLKRKTAPVKGKGVPQPCSEIACVHWVTLLSH